MADQIALLHGLNYQRAWRSFLHPDDVARLAQVDQTFAMFLMPGNVQTAAMMMPILQDEVTCLRKQLDSLTDQNRRLMIRLQRLMAQLQLEVNRRNANERSWQEEKAEVYRILRGRLEQIENLERLLQWEVRLRTYLQDIAERQLPLPQDWVATLRNRGFLF